MNDSKMSLRDKMMLVTVNRPVSIEAKARVIATHPLPRELTDTDEIPASIYDDENLGVQTIEHEK